MKVISKEKFNELEVGQIFKSDIKLIEYLEITYNRNKGEKENILIYINDYVKFQSTNNPRAKNEIEITWTADKKVFIEPMFDDRIDTLTSETMGYMLLKNIKEFGENKCFVFFSKGFLYRECQMCSPKWNDTNGDSIKYGKLANELDIDKNIVYEFYDITNNTFKRNLEKGVKNLRSRRLAMAYEGYAINIDGVHRKTTRKEDIIIQLFEKKVLDLWKISYREIWKRKRYRKFYEQVTKLINKAINENKKGLLSNSQMMIYYEDLQSLKGLRYYYEVIEFGYDYEEVCNALKQINTVTKREAKKVSKDNVKEEINKKADKMTQREGKNYKKGMNKLIKETINEPKKKK